MTKERAAALVDAIKDLIKEVMDRHSRETNEFIPDPSEYEHRISDRIIHLLRDED